MLRSVTVRGFRNLEDATWEPAHRPNLIFGPNGAGKSSLLEAVYLAATTKSFRTSRLDDCRRRDVEGFHVAVETGGDARTRIEVGFSQEGKRRAVNGATGPITEHLAVLPVVSWTTRDTELFDGPPTVRRRWVDRGLVAEKSASLAVLADYRRALEAKKAALEQRSSTLSEWNGVLASRGAALAALRGDWVARLEKELGDVLVQSRLGFTGIELRYRSSPREAVEGEAAMLEALESVAGRELRRGRVLAGPHRDDVEIAWGDRSVGRLASAGERKLLGLALLVAQGRLIGRRRVGPLFLVDDLDAELDRKRVEQVWEVLIEAPQLVATSSRKEVVSSLDGGVRCAVSNGVFGPFQPNLEKA